MYRYVFSVPARLDLNAYAQWIIQISRLDSLSPLTADACVPGAETGDPYNFDQNQNDAEMW